MHFQGDDVYYAPVQKQPLFFFFFVVAVVVYCTPQRIPFVFVGEATSSHTAVFRNEIKLVQTF